MAGEGKIQTCPTNGNVRQDVINAVDTHRHACGFQHAFLCVYIPWLKY